MARIENTIFISYRRKDKTLALAVYQYLTSQEYDVFLDYTSIPSLNFEQTIVSNIKARAHFILILTPTALDRINEPGDLFRREIETAIDEERNIVTLFFDNFGFGYPGVAEKLTGKLAKLQSYNQLSMPVGNPIGAMERLTRMFLNVSMDVVIHPISTEAQKVAKNEQFAANEAIAQKSEELIKLADEQQYPSSIDNQAPDTKAQPAPKQEATTSRDSAIPEKIGRYEIKSIIARGGVATVYRAYDPVVQREVAIKVLRGLIERNKSQVIRYEREVSFIGELRHSNIVQTLDYFIDDETLCIVMEFVDSASLAQHIKALDKRERRIPIGMVAQILQGVASALDFAHSKNIIHGDIKPANVFLRSSTQPIGIGKTLPLDVESLLTDFGLVRLLDLTMHNTSPGSVLGTPAYMSPEQSRGEKVDSRTDIYSLGIMLYEMLTGTIPFQADTTFGMLLKHISEPPPDIRKINPDLPDTIQAVIEKSMAKEPDKRFRTAGEMVNALTALLPADVASELASAETEAEIDITEVTEETKGERAIRLQAAIEANLLANNRSQAVFNDKAQGEDQLGIKNEVEALAETLLLRDVEPPVAVGVMGGWGSGKSFVMYLIDQYVQRIRAQGVKKGWADGDDPSSSLTARADVPADTPVRDGRTGDPKIPVFVGHVYQIHFNAWTYAKSNLWASLMDTIFSCLNRQMQLERLLAHREFSPEKPPSKDQIRESMLAGGDEFKKIYLDNPQLGQDKDLEKWRKNLDHWGQHLLKGTLLWNIMRGQQVETLEKLKDTEEQLNQLKSRREQFEKERPLNEITARDLDPLARKAYLQSIKSFMLAFLSDQLSTAAKDELKKQDVKEEDVQKYLEEAKGLWGGLKTVITAFRRSKLYMIWTLIFFALTFALPYVWNAYDLEPVRLQMAKIISWVLALLPTLAIVLPWVKKSIEASLEAKKILEGAYVAQQAKHAEEIANSTDMPLPQKVSELQADISNGSVAAYDALIGLLEAQAEEQRQKIGPSAKYSNLMEFVQSRLDAATYENQLGLMHQVRQDIDELTFSLVDNASPDVFPRGKPRVILYIDDLDRCPPPRVVEMLEAVQLLLNTKLFIVILGLDTRYVTRALEKEYKEILQHEGDPSGLDYIEKIIQIPYRVRAIEKDNLRLYIEKQMDIEKAPEPEPAAPNASAVQEVPTQDAQLAQNHPASNQPVQIQPAQEQAAGETNPASPTPEPVEATAAVQQDATPQTTAPRVETKAPEPPKPLEIELPAAVIQFKQEDLDDLAVCCHKVVLTPRSIKRLVNVFKLMKIFWFRADKDAGIAERDRPRAVKQAAMSLLALASAYPEVMREVFVHLDILYRQGQEKTELFTALNNIKLPPGSANELSWQLQKYKADISALKGIVGNGQDKFGQLTLQDLKLSTFNIVRSFSFVGDPVYWTDDEDEISISNGKEHQPTKTKRNSNRK